MVEVTYKMIDVVIPNTIRVYFFFCKIPFFTINGYLQISCGLGYHVAISSGRFSRSGIGIAARRV